MSYKKIIPCLDVYGNRVVKGVKFVDFKDIGDPVERAVLYEKQGADELAFLDISATSDGRKTIVDLVKRTADSISIPFTVGGGIAEIDDIKRVISAGADKISINSAAVRNPKLIEEASGLFGKERIVVAVDVKKASDGNYHVLVSGGKIDSEIEAYGWVERMEKLGAGEILLTSLDADGTKDGYDVEVTKRVAEIVSIPVTASGGCGKLEDFFEIFSSTRVNAALAASLFHFGELTVPQVKNYLAGKGINVKL